MTAPVLRPGPLEHLLLVQRHPIEVARFRGAFARGLDEATGAVLDLRVVHEHDDSCCRLEPWLVTLTTLLAQPETEVRA